MGRCMAARPLRSDPTRKWRSLVACLGALIVTAVLGSTPALAASTGKVLVFTGTAGTLSSGSADAATAIQTLGAANNFTADTTADATQINAANLANYRAVVFVNSSGDVLNASEETDLQNYVQNGGGFVGIGQTAMLEQGGAAFFNTLIGLTGNPRVTAAGTATSTQDVEFLDRVNPATRNLPALLTAHNDTWYTWTANPTGQVHTVARVRFNSIPDGSSVPNDTIQTNTTNQPQLERAASWCRDVQAGRSFYTELGANQGAYADANITKQLLGAIQWAGGWDRGNCKATITSNYKSTKITPTNPSTTSNAYTGELTNMALAPDGRIFYTGRAICSQTYTQISNWDSANVGLGCGTVHVYDPSVAVSAEPDAARINQVANLSVFGAMNGGPEQGQSSNNEEGLLGIALDPDFDNGRPYIYLEYFPYYSGEQGKNSGPALGMGFDRNSYRGERRLSRFTYDGATHTFVAGSEKVIMDWNQSVYSCCHEGSSMAWDSKGNLYITAGDMGSNAANANNGGYTDPDPALTAPCPGAAPTTHCAQTDPSQRPPGSQIFSYGDLRGTVANSATYDGKMIRIHPLADPGNTPGIGTTYTIPDANSPNGPNLFLPDSDAVKSGLAKPEIFAMGMRNDYTIHIDPKTDEITTAWVGPDQGQDSTTWGEAKTENATMLNSAGYYGWPFCQAGNRWGYRAKLAGGSGGDSRQPVGQPPEHGRRRRRRPDRRVLRLQQADHERLAVQHRPLDASGREAGEHLVRPAGRLLQLPEERQRHWHLHQFQLDGVPGHLARLPLDQQHRQPGPDGRRHLPQAGRRSSDRLAVVLGGSLVPDGLRQFQQPAARAADGPGDDEQRRAADLGRQPDQHHPHVADRRHPRGQGDVRP